MSFTSPNTVITVFGGTGFIGRHIVSQLAVTGTTTGPTLKIPSRRGSSAYFLRQFGVVGQIVPFPCSYTAEDIERAVAGSDVVINSTGILFEKGRSTFKKVHVENARNIAAACAKHNVKRFIHISALGIEKSESRYAQSKREGEEAVRAAFPAATILRPSVVFGADDQFINKFARLSVFLPALPLIMGGKTRFQPVYVADVAGAVVKAITLPDTGPQSPLGRTYELGGPEQLSFKEIFERIFTYTGRKRVLVPLPEFCARIKAAFLSLLPNPPLTNDQITSLKTDNVISGTQPGLAELDIRPTALDAILPIYLDHYRSGGRFADRERV